TPWASRRGSISTRWSRPDSGSRAGSGARARRAPAMRSPRASVRGPRKPRERCRARAGARERRRSFALHLGVPHRGVERPVRRLPAHARRNRAMGCDDRRRTARRVAGDRRAPRDARRGARTTVKPLPASLRFVERDWLSSNQIVGIDGDEATVVDTGYDKDASRTVERIRQVLDGTGARLVRIVNTHLHSDHCGGNRALADAFGCAITIPAASADEVAQWDESQ